MNFFSLLLSLLVITTVVYAKPVEDKENIAEVQEAPVNEEKISLCEKWMPVCGQMEGTEKIKFFPNPCEMDITNVFDEGPYKEVDLSICFDHVDFDQFVKDMIAQALPKV